MKRILLSVVVSVIAILSGTQMAAASSAAVLHQAQKGSVVDQRVHPTAHLVASVYPFAYRVRPGDTLSRIAAREYGSSSLWPDLWWTNFRIGKVHNPNSLKVGQHLKISSWHPGKAWARKRALAAIPAPPKIRTVAKVSSSAPAPASNTIVGGSFEQCVIERESGGNPQAVNPTSGAGGLFQFLPSTWASLGFASSYPGGAQTAPVSVQYAAFDKLYAEAGTSPWAPYDGC